MNTLRSFLVDKDAEDRRCMVDADIASACDRNVFRGAVKAILNDSTLPSGTAIRTSPELNRDLEVYAKYDGAVDTTTLITVIDKTHTLGAKQFLHAAIDHPIDDVHLLRSRQDALKRLDEASARCNAVDTLRDMANYEPDVLWMFRYAEDDALQSLYDIPYFGAWFLKGLNASSWSLTALNLHRMFVSPFIGVVSPLVSVLLPYFVLRIKVGINIGFTTYVRILFRSFVAANRMLHQSSSVVNCVKYVSYGFSLLFYFQSIFTSFEVSTTLRKVCGTLVTRVQRVARFFELAADVNARLWAGDVTAAWFPRLDDSGGCGDGGGGSDSSGSSSRASSTIVITNTCDRDAKWPWWAANFGASLKAFRGFDRDAAAAIMRRTYALDALLSVVAARRDVRACWTDFVTDNVNAGPSPIRRMPVLALDGLRHPGLPPATAVSNSWVLGAPPGSRHALLTGPNAGGKSTLLKSTLLAVLLSQTLTFAPAERCSMTPFQFISSHINVPDNQGHESLFEAEMHRAKRNLDAIKALSEHQLALVVMDEIFSSTNPVEGIAGAFAVAKRLAADPRTLCIISTHYLYLCKLERSTGKAFRNYKMPVVLDSAGITVGRPFRLCTGISRQYVALELLRKSGFDDDVIADALEVKNELLSLRNSKKAPQTSDGA